MASSEFMKYLIFKDFKALNFSLIMFKLSLTYLSRAQFFEELDTRGTTCGVSKNCFNLAGKSRLTLKNGSLPSHKIVTHELPTKPSKNSSTDEVSNCWNKSPKCYIFVQKNCVFSSYCLSQFIFRFHISDMENFKKLSLIKSRPKFVNFQNNWKS